MQCSCKTDENDQVTQPCLVHAEYARKTASSEWIQSGGKHYAAALITFIDRDERTQRKAILYPIAGLDLLNVFNDRKPETARTFTVSEGKWVEQQ